MSGGVFPFREGLAVSLAVGFCFAVLTVLVSVAFLIPGITDFRDTCLAVGLAVGFCFAELAVLVSVAFLLTGGLLISGTLESFSVIVLGGLWHALQFASEFF